jgi:uncharacterized SAM-binding protein YcdF (DUF218 family)
MRLIFTPTFLLVSGLLVLAVLATYRRDRIVASIAWVVFVAAYSMTAGMVVGAFMRYWQVPPAPECHQPHPGHTFVVLTGGASSLARQSSDVALLSQATFRRVVAAIDLASQSADSQLLISGGHPAGVVAEARIAQELVLRLGWPAERLSIEEVSVDTYTSAVEVAAALRKAEARSPVILVTSANHMRRAMFAYRSVGIDVIACSTDAADFERSAISLLPQAPALQKASEGWQEVVGLLVYRLRVAMRPAAGVS